MENAADALKMAGAVLIFVLAISVAILSFGQVRQTADIILDYRDRETIYIDGGHYYEASGTERSVGLETIIPTISRVYYENYKVVFEGLESPIYTIRLSDGTRINKYTLDLESNNGTEYQNITFANEADKSEFLCGILYGDFTKSGTKNKFQDKFNVTVPDRSLYQQLNIALRSGKTIKEYLGVYYQDDNENVPDVNKTQKRIITYVID